MEHGGPRARQVIEMPFPPSVLSGHNTGHWWKKSPVVKQFRAWAFLATKEVAPEVPADGDILVSVTFYPPNRRGDRVNFPNRMKPIFDGIADALGVNDNRFVPQYTYGQPTKGGKVSIILGPVE
jgi:Holliday junction resolvase RusA-like endonuclease